MPAAKQRNRKTFHWKHKRYDVFLIFSNRKNKNWLAWETVIWRTLNNITNVSSTVMIGYVCVGAQNVSLAPRWVMSTVISSSHLNSDHTGLIWTELLEQSPIQISKYFSSLRTTILINKQACGQLPCFECLIHVSHALHRQVGHRLNTVSFSPFNNSLRWILYHFWTWTSMWL